MPLNINKDSKKEMQVSDSKIFGSRNQSNAEEKSWHDCSPRKFNSNCLFDLMERTILDCNLTEFVDACLGGKQNNDRKTDKQETPTQNAHFKESDLCFLVYYVIF